MKGEATAPWGFIVPNATIGFAQSRRQDPVEKVYPLEPDCLKKGTFLWGNKQQDSFELLKEKLSNNPLLKLLDFSQPFEVAVDACGTGIEVVLPQTGHPIEYFSKKLSPSRQTWSTYEQEM
ncbi:retrotransposon protein, putative, unclassified [Cucumis melo var. makuwa]|uniref:Retrotransposon protein, putative, unclassified n=1 Tax=Cucumis melo var. makuwa TaxID=1194695 RepID=A0A5D3BTY6_CUCMM|nr:retrotransposon protein, putative, unclassified [Cucumis melo var. makuwa]